MAVAALSLTLGFSACSSDNDYLATDAGEGVYFPTTDPVTISLSKPNAQADFSFEVARAGITDAASYPITVTVKTDEAGVFTLPTSVSFAAGETTANVVVACNLEKAEYDAKYQFTVALGSGVPVYKFGESTYAFTVNVPSPWSEWEKFGEGTGTYYYDVCSQVIEWPASQVVPVYVRKSLIDPNAWQIKVEKYLDDDVEANDPQKDLEGLDLIFDFNPTTNKFEVPLSLGEFTVKSGDNTYRYGSAGVNYLCDELFGEVPSYLQDNYGKPCYYDPDKGVFYLNMAYIGVNLATNGVGVFSAGYETIQMAGFADYSCTIEYNGLFTDASGENSFAELATHVGDGNSSAKMMVSKDKTIDQLFADVIAGSTDAIDVPLGDKSMRAPIAGAGRYNAVLVAFNGSEVSTQASTTFNVAGGVSSNSWKPYATGFLVDGWFTSRWKFTDKEDNPITYEDLGWEVPVQQDAANPGVFRMVNPYSQEDCVLVYLGLTKPTGATANIIVDCSDKNMVKIVPQQSGLNVSQFATAIGTANPYLANLAGYWSEIEGLSDEEIAANPNFVADELDEDEIITISACLFGESAEECAYNWRDDPYAIIVLNNEDDGGASSVITKLAKYNKAKDKFAVARALAPLHKAQAKAALGARYIKMAPKGFAQIKK